jgi:thiamine pyridinylase
MKRLIVAVSILFALGCATTAPVATSQAPRPLTVALFPYIPDAGGDNFKALIAGLTSKFQQTHPDIQLTITMSGDPYDSSTWPTLFGASGPNAVEIDTLALGDLVAGNYVTPVDWQEPVFPFARPASQIGGTQYAIPTWVCMTFFYGKPGAPTMSGAWSGSWMLPSYYLVAYTDKNGYGPLDKVMTSPPDPAVVSDMALTMATCTRNGVNDCLNGTFANSPTPGLPQIEYVKGTYAATSGFSESSYYIFANGGTQPSVVAPMQLAAGQNRPLAFTDGLVVNAKSCQAQCAADVKTFAQFLNSPDTRIYICFSKDAPGKPPRRLSPASANFYQQPVVQSDWMYQQFQPAFSAAQGFPNQGFPAARKTLQKQLCTMLQVTIPDACKP